MINAYSISRDRPNCVRLGRHEMVMSSNKYCDFSLEKTRTHKAIGVPIELSSPPPPPRRPYTCGPRPTDTTDTKPVATHAHTGLFNSSPGQCAGQRAHSSFIPQRETSSHVGLSVLFVCLCVSHTTRIQSSRPIQLDPAQACDNSQIACY